MKSPHHHLPCRSCGDIMDAIFDYEAREDCWKCDGKAGGFTHYDILDLKEIANDQQHSKTTE